MKPHVVHIVESLAIGGLERLVYDFVIGRQGGRNSVLCVESVGAFGEDLAAKGYSVESLDWSHGRLTTILAMRRYLLKERPDLLHCHNGTAYFFGSIGSWLAGDIPVVLTKHNPRPFMGALAGRVNRRMLRRSINVGVSKQTTAALDSWLPNGSPPARYIPNGISLAPYQGLPEKLEARRLLGWSTEAFLIGIVARLIPTKGHLFLLDSLARLLKQAPEARVVIVGDGEMRPAVEARIRDLGLESSVMFLGERNDMPLIWAALDVFCLPSETEGMPVTVLEAMAASLPIVASDVGGIPQLIEDGVSGMLFPISNLPRMDELLLDVRNHPDRARGMGRAAQARVERDFSLTRVQNDYEALYAEAMASR